jgi:hypothetical protein
MKWQVFGEYCVTRSNAPSDFRKRSITDNTFLSRIYWFTETGVLRKQRTLVGCWQWAGDSCTEVRQPLLVGASAQLWGNVDKMELHNLYSSSNIRMIKWRTVRWAGYVTRMGKKRNAYRVLVENSEWKRPLRRSRRIIIIIIIIISGMGLSSLGTVDTSGLLYKPQMIDEGDCGAIGGMKIGRGNQSTWRKRAPAPLCPPQIPHDQTRARTPDRRGGKPATNSLSYCAAGKI